MLEKVSRQITNRIGELEERIFRSTKQNENNIINVGMSRSISKASNLNGGYFGGGSGGSVIGFGEQNASAARCKKLDALIQQQNSQNEEIINELDNLKTAINDIKELLMSKQGIPELSFPSSQSSILQQRNVPSIIDETRCQSTLTGKGIQRQPIRRVSMAATQQYIDNCSDTTFISDITQDLYSSDLSMIPAVSLQQNQQTLLKQQQLELQRQQHQLRQNYYSTKKCKINHQQNNKNNNNFYNPNNNSSSSSSSKNNSSYRQNSYKNCNSKYHCNIRCH